MRSIFYFTTLLLVVSCSQNPNLLSTNSADSYSTAVIYTPTKDQENKAVSEILSLRDKEGTVKHITVLTDGQPPTYIFIKGEHSALFNNKNLAKYLRSDEELKYQTTTISVTKIETFLGWISYFSGSWVIESAYEISPGEYKVTAIKPVIEYLKNISCSDE